MNPRQRNVQIAGRVYGLTVLALIFSSLPISSGCGSSKEDLILRAAKRNRPTSGTDEEERQAERQTDQAVVAATADDHKATAAASPDPSSDAEGEPNRDADAGDAESGSATAQSGGGGSVVPIDQRKPAEPLSKEERRERAYENIVAIGKALEEYYDQHGTYPKSHSETSGGIPALSWRVTLLPYLGYEELYKKFDPSKPWNMEPNKSLLQYIPDAYVSPERFDTATNYLLPANERFMFGANRGPRYSQIEDGPENTIMLVEVNDELAVPWTKPSDFEPDDWTDFKDDLGGVREDGTFALWANGWPVLLSSSLTSQQLQMALTYEMGDRLTAGEVHRNITIEGVSEEAVATQEDKAPVKSDTESDRPESSPPPGPAEPELVRAPVPPSSDIREAQKRLRDVFAERIDKANTDDERTELADEMLDRAAEMLESDPAGAYAVQTAALRLAINGGGIEEVLRGVDQRVAEFEVDAYQENVEWLIRFGEENLNRPPDSVDGMRYLERVTHAVSAAISGDHYLDASRLVGYAYRFIDRSGADELPKNLNLLRSLLRTAERQYNASKEALADYRDDPSNGDAAAAIGRFLCFYKGDWQTGLPLLAQGGSRELSTLAEKDLQGAKSYQEQVALGDAWWELSEKARSRVYRQGTRDRAAHWYRIAYSVMPDSLDKLHVKGRLDEADDEPATSPIAVVETVAEEVGTDLSISLSGLAMPESRDAGRRRGGRPKLLSDNDDED